MRLPSVVILGTRGYPSFYGGFETAVRHIAPFLADKGWDVTVYGRKGSVSTNFKADPRIRTIETRGMNSRSLSTLSYGATSGFSAASKGFDVALVMNVANGYWLPILKAARIPTLVNVDGIEWERAKWGRVAKKVFLLGAKLTAKIATEIIVDSKEIGKYWSTRFNRDGIFIPYGGTAPGVLPLEPGLESKAYILVVARFVPENSIAFFFEAAPALSKKYKVVIVGSSGFGGYFDDQARLLQRENPNVLWLGHVSDDDRLLSLWQHAGTYFHGHTVGGTNPALVQAMACGSPIVAMDTAFNREVLGDSSLFVNSPSEITHKILEVMGDVKLQERLAASNIDKARELYTWEKVCESYEKSLRLLVRETPNT
jgi:glycosyltransferase involved in cell wall biosynthesis